MKLINGWVDTASEDNLMTNSMSRSGYKVSHIVVHGTAGGSNGNAVIDYMRGAGVSTHFVISADGTIWQAVSTEVAAWGNAPLKSPRLAFDNADTNPNYWTISVEFAKPDTTNVIDITPQQLASGIALIGLLCDAYGVPKRRGDGHSGIISHADINTIDRSMCPGTFPWDALIAGLNPQPTPVAVNTPAWMKYTTYSGKVGGTTAVALNDNMAKDALAEFELFGASLYNGKPLKDQLNYGSGIASDWKDLYGRGLRMGPVTSPEYHSVDWGGNPIIVQQFQHARCEWNNGKGRWFGPYGEVIR